MTNEQPTSALAKPKKQISEWLQGEDFKRQLAMALPQNMSPERFVRIALTATLKQPKLLNCTQESFFKCLLDLSAMGLEPDGRRAHLIPFGDECGLIVDYKGLCELVRRNGDVVYIHCDVVGVNDQFVCRFGTGGKLEHIPAIRDRGEIYAVYSFVRLKNGSEEFDIMSVEEVEKIRQRSKAPDSEPWTIFWPEMAKKTIFRRHSKILPLSPQTRDAVEHDDEFFVEAKPAVGQVVEPNFAGLKAAVGAVTPPKPRRVRPPKEPVSETLDETFQGAARRGAARPGEASQGEAATAGSPPNADPEPLNEQKGKANSPALGPREEVATRLTQANQKHEDFLRLLAHVGLIEADAADIEMGHVALSDVPLVSLETALGDWENVTASLHQKVWEQKR